MATSTLSQSHGLRKLEIIGYVVILQNEYRPSHLFGEYIINSVIWLGGPNACSALSALSHVESTCDEQIIECDINIGSDDTVFVKATRVIV